MFPHVIISNRSVGCEQDQENICLDYFRACTSNCGCPWSNVASLLSPKYEVFRCDQNGPPARRSEPDWRAIQPPAHFHRHPLCRGSAAYLFSALPQSFSSSSSSFVLGLGSMRFAGWQKDEWRKQADGSFARSPKNGRGRRRERLKQGAQVGRPSTGLGQVLSTRVIHPCQRRWPIT